jgi:dTMP kinase
MLLYMASRAQMVEEIIAPALSAGQVVVSDRYLLANIVYQGSAGGLLEEEIAMVGMIATSGVLPDLTIVLDIPPAVARARVGEARDRMEDRTLFYRERVRAGYLGAARSQGEGGGRPDAKAAAKCAYYPVPIVLVDAAADSDTVFERIQSEVVHALALDPRP